MNSCLLTNFNKINEGYADLDCSNKLKYGPRTMRAWLVSKMSFLNNSVHLSNEYLNLFRPLFLEQAMWVKKISLTSLTRSSNGSGQELTQSCKEADLWESWAPCFLFFCTLQNYLCFDLAMGIAPRTGTYYKNTVVVTFLLRYAIELFLKLWVRRLWNLHVFIGRTKFVRHSSFEPVYCLLLHHAAIN